MATGGCGSSLVTLGLTMLQLVGLLVLLIGASFVFPAVFGRKPQPILVGSADGTIAAGDHVVAPAAPTIRWYHRVRGIVGLLMITGAIGAFVAVVLSVAVLFLGGLIQG